MKYRRPGIPGSLVLALLLSSAFFALAADVKKCVVCGMVVDEK